VTAATAHAPPAPVGFSARIAAHPGAITDIAISIKHVDRVVGHGLDEHIQLALNIRDFLRGLRFVIRHTNTPPMKDRYRVSAPFPVI
jgi:hypothetical protein